MIGFNFREFLKMWRALKREGICYTLYVNEFTKEYTNG